MGEIKEGGGNSRFARTHKEQKEGGRSRNKTSLRKRSERSPGVGVCERVVLGGETERERKGREDV